MRQFFITGTDTAVGKTYATACLLRMFRQQGKRTSALKPISSGIDLPETVNSDVIALAKEVTVSCTFEEINPVCFKLPIAPSIAAVAEQRPLNVSNIWESCQPMLQKPADIILVEGVGGFCVPLNDHETTVDLAKKFAFPIILVVGLRLGCLNHAILTYQAIVNAKLAIAGWIGNQVDPEMQAYVENIEALKQLLPISCLGIIPFQQELAPTEAFYQMVAI